MKDLIFIGGAKGVGKSTIMEGISRITDLPIVNTGKIYVQAKQENKNPESEIISFLKDYNGIVDTHYAGYHNDGFVRALSIDNLIGLAAVKSLDFILIDTDLEQLMLRRNNDETKSRIHDNVHAYNELIMNKSYFLEYCKDLNINGLILNNNLVDESIHRILERIYHGK
jgi:adenylate kinase